MKRASLSMFIAKLKELEYVYRQKILKKIGQGMNNVIVEVPKQEMLPLSTIFSYLDQNQEEIEALRYSLRSQKLKGEFIKVLHDLSKSCWEYFFSENEFLEVNMNENGIWIFINLFKF